MAEKHVLEAGLEIFVGALQEAVQLVHMLEEDVGHVCYRLLEVLVQQVDSEDDLGGGFGEGMELCLGVVAPMAVVCKVVL